jgi:hypothetical protein
MAALAAANGDVVRDHKQTVQQWQPAAVGAEFEFGDAVRTMDQATGEVKFNDGARMKLDPSTTVRFMRFAPDAKQVGIDVESGQAVLEAGDSELRMHTRVGLAILQPGTTAHVGKGKQGIRFFVSVGLARLESDGAPAVDVRAGHGVEIGIGMAILDTFEAKPEPSEAPTIAEPEAPKVDPSNLPIVAKVSGRSVSIRKPGSKRFEPLPEGEHVVEPGTQLKLTAKDTTTVTRGTTQAGLAGPGTYLVVGEGPQIINPVSGSITLSADGHDVSIELPGGKVTALGSHGLSVGDVHVGTRRDVSIKARAGRLQLDVGKETSMLSAGETASISGGKVIVQGRGPDFADLATPAGGSLVIHDPSPPSAVGVQFAKNCPHLGILERVSGSRVLASSVGSGTATLRFDAGRHKYQLRCLSKAGELGGVAAQGGITVYRDGGTSALPSKAPSTLVNTDGRSYTVLYQNLLPSISVRWPNAPPAPSYTLTVKTGGSTKTTSVNSASFAFPSGKLKEGTHTMQFSSSQGRSSRMSTVTIRFDNAAPKASIKTPVDGSFAGGQSVNVSGIALPGWTVSAQGQALRMDSQHRFNSSVGTGGRSLVLQFAHPTRGTHHYLRRASGVPR